MLATPVAAATVCPDLSGRYVIQGEDGRVFVVIRQTRCASARIEWRAVSFSGEIRTTHTYVLDDKRRTVGRPWDDGKGLSRATFSGDTLVIVAGSARASLQLLSNGDLCVGSKDHDRDPWTGLTAGHQTDTTLASIDAAAARSEAGMAKPCR